MADSNAFVPGLDRPPTAVGKQRRTSWWIADVALLEDSVVPEIADIESKVKKIVSEQLAVSEEELSRDTTFTNDLNADSLDIVELVMEFEDEFDMSIPDEEAEKIQTIGQAIDYIKAHLDNNK